MNKEDVIEFFDGCAPRWDADMIKDDNTINKILDNAGVTEGKDVLDVACGTGVLIPYYLERKVNSVTAIDISPKMAEIARQKFESDNVKIICGDVEGENFSNQFDCCVVYNAFPHFPDPVVLMEVLSGLVKQDGFLSVAHGMSRAKIDHHHSGSASKISKGLMHEDKLADIMSKWLTITTKISNDNMYQVCGRKTCMSLRK